MIKLYLHSLGLHGKYTSAQDHSGAAQRLGEQTEWPGSSTGSFGHSPPIQQIYFLHEYGNLETG